MFLYYANKQSEKQNRHLQNIAAVVSNTRNVHSERNRLTASVLLPWLHSWLQYLPVKNQTHGSHIA